MVRILVSQQGGADPISPEQWISVRALVTAINWTFSEETGPLPVRLQDEWSGFYGLAPQTYSDHPAVGSR